jgi:ABC-type sugar transport system ATPase subunit
MEKSNKNIAEMETDKRIDEMSIESDYITSLPKTLPEGIKQLTSIAREKNHDIDLFLLDEPMSNLDKKIHLEIRIFFKKFIKEFNKTTLITLNNPEDALSISDYMAILDNGNLVQFGETFEVYKNPVSKIVMEETTRLRLNTIDVEVNKGKIMPFGLHTEEYDGEYELCFRADEIELKDNGIEAKITSKQFYDGSRIIADCMTKDCFQMTLLLPLNTKDTFSFIPTDPKLFKMN